MALGYDENGKKYEEAIKPVTDKTGITKYEKETVEDALSYPIVAIPDRGLVKATCAHFEIRCKLNELDEVEKIYFPCHKERGEVGSGDFYTSGFKIKDLTQPKKVPKGQRSYHFTTVGEVDYECLLFGIAQAKKLSGQRFLTTEGELDCAAYFQACAMFHGKRGEKGKIYDLVMLSIGFGTSTAVKHISTERNQYYLSKFTKPILCFDNDETTPEEYKKGMRKGKEATRAVISMYPEYLIANTRYELNDPNDMLLADRGDDLFWAYMKPDTYQSEAFIDVANYEGQIILLPTIEDEWPWDAMNRITFGKRSCEVHYLGAGVKQGKSEHLNKNVSHIRQNPKKGPPTVFKFEEPPATTIRKIIGYEAGYKFHDPGKVIYPGNKDVFGDPLPADLTGYFTQQDLIDAYKRFDHDSIVVYNPEGNPDWEKMKEDIRYAHFVRGSQDFFIDPLTAFSEGVDPSEANTILGGICRDLYSMALDFKVNFYVYCHLNPPKFGPPHELGGKVTSLQFTGARAMQRAGHGLWGLERNKDDRLPKIITNMSEIILLDERFLGLSGRFKLWYDGLTGDYIEPTQEQLEEYEEAVAYDGEGKYNGSPVRRVKSKSVENGPTGFNSADDSEDWLKDVKEAQE